MMGYERNIPNHAEVQDLVQLRSELEIRDGCACIVHRFGPVTVSWYDNHPELVCVDTPMPLRDAVWLSRTQLAYVLDRHRTAVRKRPELQSQGCDLWDMSRYSLGREICLTLRTRGYHVPDDFASADVIGAVGMALDRSRDPLLRYRSALAERINVPDSDNIEHDDLFKSMHDLHEKARSEFKIFDRLSAQTGKAMVDLCAEALMQIEYLMQVCHVTTKKNWHVTLPVKQEFVPAPAPVTEPTVAVADDKITILPFPEMPRKKPNFDLGFLIRPNPDNIEACALYDRFQELIENQTQFSVGRGSDNTEFIVALTPCRNNTGDQAT